MPEYRSNLGGLYNSGVQPNSRPQIDIGGLLQAVGSGTGSLIHAAMQRKQVENQAKLQQNELALRQQAQTRQDAHDTWQQGFDREKFEEQKAVQARQDALAGYVPGTSKTVADTVPTGETMPIQSMSPIRKALAPPAAAAPGTMPGPQLTPSAEPQMPAPAAVPVVRDQPATVTTPATVDLSKNVTYAKTIDAANARATAAETRAAERDRAADQRQQRMLEDRQKGREFAASAASGLAQWKRNNPPATTPIQKARMQGQQDAMMTKVAGGYLAEHAGNLQETVDALSNTEEGKALAAQGMTSNHILAAYKQPKPEGDKDTGRILGLVSSGAAQGKTNEERIADAAKTVSAAKAASKTSRLVAPGAKAPAAAPKDDFTDDEAAAAWTAGKRTDSDIADWIRAQRKKKP